MRIHYRVKGSPQLLVTTNSLPDQETYDMQLTISDKLLQISETLDFSVRFNLTPRIDLMHQPDEVSYRVA